MLQKLLLLAGIASSATYAAMNIVVPLTWPAYDWTSQTVSELSAIGAPTRSLWVSLSWIYSILIIAFGIGILRTAKSSRCLCAAGWLMLASAVFGLFWPPMHLRGIAPTLTDTLHIVWTALWGLTAFATIGFSAAAFGSRFRIYSAATVATMLVFGFLTSLTAPNVPKGLPTPNIGIWERINIGAQLIWIVVLAAVLWRAESRSAVAELETGRSPSALRYNSSVRAHRASKYPGSPRTRRHV